MVSLIIPSAGAGKRSGSAVPKQYVNLLGKPIIVHTLLAFVGKVQELIISVDEQYIDITREYVYPFASHFQRLEIVIGGSERQHSIFNALQIISPNTEIVLVHDAARPNPSSRLIDEVIKYAKIYDGATPGLTPADTIKKIKFVENNLENSIRNNKKNQTLNDNSNDCVIVDNTLNRQMLVATQTPQGFKANILKAAYKLAYEQNYLATDDASLVEWNNGEIIITKGEPTNLKITYPIDFKIAEFYLSEKNESHERF